jgi:hypothetical protein
VNQTTTPETSAAKPVDTLGQAAAPKPLDLRTQEEIDAKNARLQRQAAMQPVVSSSPQPDAPLEHADMGGTKTVAPTPDSERVNPFKIKSELEKQQEEASVETPDASPQPVVEQPAVTGQAVPTEQAPAQPEQVQASEGVAPEAGQVPQVQEQPAKKPGFFGRLFGKK